jgi:hypothetical protein
MSYWITFLSIKLSGGHARLITLAAATSGHSPFLDVLQISFVGQVFAGPSPRGVVDVHAM